jgi:peptidoglycan/LPS O-acetylase OafA/YrhL
MSVSDNREKTLCSPEARTGFHLGYRRWLDGLRGVAILLVMASHVFLVPGGFLGVDIFFVLSGFLITSLLLEEWQQSGCIRLKRFYLRRALRLMPGFATLLVICGLSSLWLPSAAERWARCREVGVAACYVANWPSLHRTHMPLLGHSWSLSVEEQFYLLWPLLLGSLLQLRLSRRRIVFLVGCGIVASAGLRMGLYHWYQSRGVDQIAAITRLYMGLDTRADALLVGCLLGLLATWNLLPRSRRFLQWAGGSSIIFLFYLGYLSWNRNLLSSQFYDGLFTVVALMTAVLIARLLSTPLPVVSWILESAPLVGVGRISYALYLFHMPILHLFLPVCARGYYWTGVALFVGTTFLAAGLSYYLIERPCLRLKERFRPQAAVNPPASLRLQDLPVVAGPTQAVA